MSTPCYVKFSRLQVKGIDSHRWQIIGQECVVEKLRGLGPATGQPKRENCIGGHERVSRIPPESPHQRDTCQSHFTGIGGIPASRSAWQ